FSAVIEVEKAGLWRRPRQTETRGKFVLDFIPIREYNGTMGTPCPNKENLMDCKRPIAECQWCGKAMTLWVYGQRFCCRQCSDHFYAAERRQAIDRFRAEGHVVETKRMKAATA